MKDLKFRISTDKSEMDIDFIHNYLSNKSYWAQGRSKDQIKKSIENSLCFGVFNENNKQVAFARIVTDYVVFAWLMDVFVDENLQNKGVGKFLMNYIVNFTSLKEVKGIGLRTKDAHSLYEKYGFEVISDAEKWMIKKRV